MKIGIEKVRPLNDRVIVEKLYKKEEKTQSVLHNNY